jgi:hypothetical protein
MTRLLRFAKLRKRRGEIEAGKRPVGWPSTRPVAVSYRLIASRE